MKITRFGILSLFVLGALESVIAQDYAPLRSDDVWYFQYSGSDFQGNSSSNTSWEILNQLSGANIGQEPTLYDATHYFTNPIFVDSIDVVGTDTIYHLNRIFQPISPAFPYECGVDFESRLRAPQFLGRTITNYGDTLYAIRGIEDFTIKSNTSVGSEWLFDSVAQVSAMVDSIVFGPVVASGEADSVKFISLSDGRQFRLSKHHGVTEFFAPDADERFYLLGKRSGLGEQPLTALDLTGWLMAGDSIFRKGISYSCCPGESNQGFSRSSVPDWYLVDTASTLQEFVYDGLNEDLPIPPIDRSFPAEPHTPYFTSNNPNSEFQYYTNGILRVPDGRLITYTAYFVFYLTSDPDCDENYGEADIYCDFWLEGIGKLGSASTYFEWGHQRGIVGITRNTERIFGTVNVLFSNTSQSPKVHSLLEATPNPTSDRLNIFLKTAPGAGPHTGELLDATGRTVRRFAGSDSDVTYLLDVADLPAGVYFLRVVVDGRWVRTERVVMQ